MNLGSRAVSWFSRKRPVGAEWKLVGNCSATKWCIRPEAGGWLLTISYAYCHGFTRHQLCTHHFGQRDSTSYKIEERRAKVTCVMQVSITFTWATARAQRENIAQGEIRAGTALQAHGLKPAPSFRSDAGNIQNIQAAIYVRDQAL